MSNNTCDFEESTGLSINLAYLFFIALIFFISNKVIKNQRHSKLDFYVPGDHTLAMIEYTRRQATSFSSVLNFIRDALWAFSSALVPFKLAETFFFMFIFFIAGTQSIRMLSEAATRLFIYPINIQTNKERIMSLIGATLGVFCWGVPFILMGMETKNKWLVGILCGVYEAIPQSLCAERSQATKPSMLLKFLFYCLAGLFWKNSANLLCLDFVDYKINWKLTYELAYLALKSVVLGLTVMTGNVIASTASTRLSTSPEKFFKLACHKCNIHADTTQKLITTRRHDPSTT